jgi:uncharacterized protein (DUF362 family)
MKQLSRAEFLKMMGVAGAGVAAFGAGAVFGAAPAEAGAADELGLLGATLPHMTVVHGASAAAITRKAIAALGGMGRFVRPGQSVVIKPNICTARAPQYATTTNPTVVATLVSLCKAAGARSVHVMDYPISATPQAAYKWSGIGAAVARAGGRMVIMSPTNWVSRPIPKGKWLHSWTFYREALNADVLINVPVLKDHGLDLTIGGKNMMGLITSRKKLHGNLSQGIADVTSVLRPDLTVVDCVRIHVNHGPTGGTLNDVRVKNIVIASKDVVAADTYAATKVFGARLSNTPYISAMARIGLGTTKLSSIHIAKYNL